MNPILPLRRIKVFKAWEPDSEPISVIYRPRDNFNDAAENVIKVFELDESPQDLIISSANPLIPEIDSTKTFQEQGITYMSQLYVNIKNSGRKKPINLLKRQRPAHCTPLVKLIEKDGKNLAPAEYDLTQKIIILYGIAANLYQYHEFSPIKTNVTPNYILVDDEYRPYIDYDKLKTDSQKADFEISSKYKPYLPPENKRQSLSQDFDEAEMKANIYIFGSLCISIIKKKILTEKTRNDPITQVPPKLLNLIDLCRDENQNKRPTFCDILFILTSQVFIDDLENFDAERFRKYQETVVNEEFITEINSHFDIKKIPGVRIMQHSDFTVDKKLIGKGMSGTVHVAADNENGTKVAYKELNSDINEKDQMRIYREIEILASADHYAVQKLYGYIESNEKERLPSVILTLYESNGSLNKFIDKKYSKLDFTQKYIIMYGIASGMYYLHKRNIMHRDIKPENILITKHLEPQITDFGLSKVSQENEMFQSIVITGTPIYMAPELLDTREGDFFSLYDARLADVYAFGLVLVYLFTGKRPWSDVKQLFSLANKSLAGERPSLPQDFPKMLRLLIQACWDQEPTERPSFENILHIIGNQSFIDNLGQEIDMKRFIAYQKKVALDESFYTENLSTRTNVKGIQEENIIIDGIKFPKIPEDKFCSILDFTVLSEGKDESNNPFFIVRKAKLTSKPKNLFKIFKIKDEFIEDVDILNCYSTQIQVMLSVNHPAINALYGNLNMPYKRNSKEDSLFDYFPKEVKGLPELVVPTYKKGNLHTNLHNFTITEKFIILYGMAAGMNYLHKKNMVHLNLKPENISLNDKYEPLIDIDLTSRPKTSKENLFYLLPIFSHAYVAPELLSFDEKQNTNVNAKMADVYSFGMIAYYVMTGIQPFDSKRGFQYVLMKIKNGERPLTSGIVPYPFDKLIEECWDTDPKQRPTFESILSKMGSSNFVRSIEHIDVKKFQKYQGKVVDKKLISSISQCAIRTRDEFELKKMIGSGMFGNVKLAIDKVNNSKVAFKEIPSKDNNFIEREKQILSTMNYPSIITLYGLIEPDGEKENSVILLPYAPNGDLDKMLQMEAKNKEKVPSGWDYTQKCIVLYGIAMGMYKLHQKDIIHRDLKPQNILLNDSLEPVITDFELSKFVDPNQSMFQSMVVGTPYYMSPESFDDRNEIEDDENENGNRKKRTYDGKLSDVYSFGMLIFYLMSGIQPWANIKTQYNLMQKVIDGIRPTIPDNIEEPVSDLITTCWKPSPKDRPIFDKICDVVSDPKFYSNPNEHFDKKRFYEYQLKLGDTEYIKFTQEEIDGFKEPDGPYTPRKPIVKNTIQILKEKADDGDAESQYRYGCLLKEGTEIEQDLEGAAHYFKLSSDQSYLDGIIAYATCLKDGDGVEKNETEAINLMKSLVDKNITEAQIILANWYAEMRPRKYGLAYELYKKADEKDYPDASALIGILMEKKKLGVNPSNDEIVQYYKKACRLGSSAGIYHMATCYHYGIGVDKNIKEAIRLYTISTKIQDQNQSPAIFSLTVLLEETGDFENAFSIADYYRDEDMFIGYVRCSEFYNKGIGVEKDEKIAKEYMDIACNKRFASDQLSLALLYSRAKGVTQNKEQTFFWTEIAAKNGNIPAQSNLASYYLDGYGCKQDVEKAEEYGIMSSDAGNGHAMWALARIYKKKKNDAKELEYLEKAAKNGYEKALVDLGKKYKDKKKNAEAVECFKEAADNRIPLGLFYYGRELMHGKHVPKSFDEGFKMLEDAAEMGCREAVKKLIDIYAKGEGSIEKDEEKKEKYTDVLAKMDKGKRRKSVY